MRRAAHVDFHTMAGITDFNAGWDAQAFARTLADAHVEYVNAFARCNIGFAYYPTQVGTPYPGMKGDMFGDLLAACRKRNIGVSAYVNVGLDHMKAVEHMDWLRLDGEGRVINHAKGGNFFRTMCHNNPGYRSYLMDMLAEIAAYDPDGYFLDCMGIVYCCCPHCQEEMRRRGLDPFDWQQNMEFQQQTYVEFSEAVTRLAGPGKYLFFNGMHYDRVAHIQTHMEIECLPAAWGYDYFWPYVSYARTLYDTVVYMSGRFQVSWADFGGLKSLASLEHDAYDALCAGVGFSVGDHQHPARNLSRPVYERVRAVNEQLLALEPYTQGARFLADAAVLIKQGGRELDPGKEHWGPPISDACRGLSRMLGELRVSCDFIHETMDFSRYPLLILADDFPMDDGIEAKLTQYVQNGGKLLATGTAGLKADRSGFIEPLAGFGFQGVDTRNHAYFTFVKNDDPRLEDMEYSQYSQSGVLFSGGDVLAHDVDGYFNEGWDGLQYTFYIPPWGPTGRAAAAVSDDGRAACIAFSVFGAYLEGAPTPHKALVRQCLDRLIPGRLIKTRGVPSTARVTATGTDEYLLLHVKTTYPEVRGNAGVIEEHAVLEAGAEVSLRGTFKSARTLPDLAPVEIVQEPQERTTVKLPRIVGYQAIQLMQ